jgi:hypothetical protein
MAFTLDPEVAEALAPFAAETADTTPPPVGDVATRRATLKGIFHYGDTAQQLPDDVTITDHELEASNRLPPPRLSSVLERRAQSDDFFKAAQLQSVGSGTHASPTNRPTDTTQTATWRQR